MRKNIRNVLILFGVLVCAMAGANFWIDLVTARKVEQIAELLQATLERRTAPVKIDFTDRERYLGKCQNEYIHLRSIYAFYFKRRYDYEATCGRAEKFEISCFTEPKLFCDTHESREEMMRSLAIKSHEAQIKK